VSARTGKTDILGAFVGIFLARCAVGWVLATIHGITRIIGTRIAVGTADGLAGTISAQTKVKLRAYAGIVTLHHVAERVVRTEPVRTDIFCAHVVVVFTGRTAVGRMFTPDSRVARIIGTRIPIIAVHHQARTGRAKTKVGLGTGVAIVTILNARKLRVLTETDRVAQILGALVPVVLARVANRSKGP